MASSHAAEAAARPRYDLWLASAGVAISLFTGWLAVRRVDFSALGEAIAAARPAPLVLGTVAILLSYPVLALRWRAVARGVGVLPRRDAVDWLLIGSAVNNVVPGRAGEFVRAFGLSRCVRRPYLSALGAVAIDRAIDAFFFGACLAGTVWLASDVGWVRWIAAVAGVAMAATAAAAVLLVLWARRTAGDGAVTGWRRHLVAGAQGLSTLRHPRQLAVVIAGTLLAWAAVAAGGLLIAEAIGLDLSAGEMIFTIAVASLGTAIPSAPGFVGTYHWLVASSVQLFGADPSSALAFAIALHAAWFVPTTVVGLALLTHRGLTLASLRREVRAGRAG